MPALAQVICAGIARGDDEAFLGAGEVARTFHLGARGFEAIEPWSALIKADPPTENSMRELKAALLDALKSGDARIVSNAAAALSNFWDEDLVPELRQALATAFRGLRWHEAAVSNLVHALASCGKEKVLEDGYNFPPPHKAIGDVFLYLERHGYKEQS